MAAKTVRSIPACLDTVHQTIDQNFNHYHYFFLGYRSIISTSLSFWIVIRIYIYIYLIFYIYIYLSLSLSPHVNSKSHINPIVYPQIPYKSHSQLSQFCLSHPLFSTGKTARWARRQRAEVWCRHHGRVPGQVPWQSNQHEIHKIYKVNLTWMI